MLKFNKKNLLNLEYLNNTPLLPSNSKGENIKQSIIFKIKKDINGMEIIYGVIKKKN